MTEKIDYTSWSEDSAEFLPKLRRVFQDINIRIASIEDTGRKLADIERRYGVVALERISEAITPAITEARALLSKVETDLAALDQAYRQDGQQRVDDIINPLIDQARKALEKTKTDLAAIDLSYRQEGQRRVDDIINPLLTQTKTTLADAEAALAAINAVVSSMQSLSEKGQPEGYAGLDAEGKVPVAQLPPLSTSSTVGAAIAAPTPSIELVDGDKVAGIGTGGAVLKTWSFSVVKNWIKGWIGKTDVNLGNVANKSEAQMVASGAIADALSGKLGTSGGNIDGPLAVQGNVLTLKNGTEGAQAPLVEFRRMTGPTQMRLYQQADGSISFDAYHHTTGAWLQTPLTVRWGGGIHVNGGIQLVGDLITNGNLSAFSDERLKTDKKLISGALEMTMQLNGYSYVKDGRQQYGLIAQEVREIVPEAVFENSDENDQFLKAGHKTGTLSVAADNTLLAVVIEAVKELAVEVEVLKERLK